MSKFKAGDRVRRVKYGKTSDKGVKVGDVITVVGGCIYSERLFDCGNEDWYFYDEDFELVNENTNEKEYSLETLVDTWFNNLQELAKEDPEDFLNRVEGYLNSCDIEDICTKLDNIRDSLEGLRIAVEEKMSPKFGVEKLHSLIKLVDVTKLVGTYYRQAHPLPDYAEALFLNASGKIRPPVNTHQVGDTFTIESISGILGGQELDYPAMIELLNKL